MSQFSDRVQALGFSADMARSQMGLLIRQQATLLGLNDAFLLGTYVFVALTAFVWLAQSTVAPTKRIEGFRGRSRRNDGAGMIRRFLSLVSGVGVSLLLGGRAFLPQGGERAEFRDPQPMDRTLSQAGQR